MRYPSSTLPCLTGISARFHGLPSPAATWLPAITALACLGVVSTTLSAAEPANLLRNPGFENASDPNLLAGWTATADSAQKATPSGTGSHSGQRCAAIPAQSAIEQHVDHAQPGPYLARLWVKSEADQKITVLLSDPARPWAAYSCSEIQVPKGEWKQVEAFCTLDKEGGLTLAVGGTSKEFRSYHGPETEMRAAILVDDCQLFRYEPSTVAELRVLDAKGTGNAPLTLPLAGLPVAPDKSTFDFAETVVFQARHLVGTVRRNDGGLALYTTDGASLKPRGLIIPSTEFEVAQCLLVKAGGRTGLRLVARNGEASYTAWISPKGLVSVESKKIPEFTVRGSRMSYGLLPSFVGTDLCYNPAKLTGVTKATLPSTQWFVGLVEGNDSLLVAAWNSPTQAVSLGLVGDGDKRTFDSLSIDTTQTGFSLSFVEHRDIWHKEALKEDYLGDYTPIGWQRPFPARWMGQFFTSPGGKASFHSPYNDYSFPIASAKTRMWGVWFEDWNHYPFYFDGDKTVVHFEKSFAPNGDALIYFLEPAAADLYSPCEIVQEALGAEKAAALFDFDANGLRRLKYSTPPLFMYDRPVCATTTRLSKIKQEEKPTVGVNLATHLYEFIREIRGRVDQYSAYFTSMKGYLEQEESTHAELKPYLADLEKLVAEAQSKTKKVYDTPLPTVQAKIEAMKKQLEQGQGDGFDCGNLDVRSPAGEQDDLCRRYNRLVLRLVQTAALNCGDSTEKAVVARHIWEESRAVLHQPTRWEPRRTVYFFEP
ncbi:MAG TPA: carbohydrate binding domain-containing protein [Candidatus Limnocylindria bacterium]|jgi:hypothetical protein|nr:carbohydrate binding domain-containing protein [Candidatus Limnocylindria bacterium]